jgi:hypothetical protein
VNPGPPNPPVRNRALHQKPTGSAAPLRVGWDPPRDFAPTTLEVVFRRRPCAAVDRRTGARPWRNPGTAAGAISGRVLPPGASGLRCAGGRGSVRHALAVSRPPPRPTRGPGRPGRRNFLSPAQHPPVCRRPQSQSRIAGRGLSQPPQRAGQRTARPLRPAARGHRGGARVRPARIRRGADPPDRRARDDRRGAAPRPRPQRPDRGRGLERATRLEAGIVSPPPAIGPTARANSRWCGPPPISRTGWCPRNAASCANWPPISPPSPGSPGANPRTGPRAMPCTSRRKPRACGCPRTCRPIFCGGSPPSMRSARP